MDYTKPLILIIDLDGCIIGDIKPQIMYYEVITNIKKVNQDIKIDNKDLIEKLKFGIIRPYFENFCKSIKSYFPNMEFFIYTASETRWANFIVKHIEKSINFKFRRPIFTRDDCQFINDDFQKNIENIIPKIKRSLYVRWGKINLKNNFMLIDNNMVYRRNNINKLLICPTYDYKYCENIPKHISHKIFLTSYRTIHSILSKYYLYRCSDDYFEFQLEFYKYYVNYLKFVEINNKIFLHDTFWKDLSKILIKKKFNKWGDQQIDYIKKKISKKNY